MIRRLYVHNFRCLENFELRLAGQSSGLLIGKNGSGKTTVGAALEILQKIGRGVNRVGSLVKTQDFSHGHSERPMRIEIDVDVKGATYEYAIALELPAGFKELRVFEEKFTVGGVPVYSRELAQVSLARAGTDRESKLVSLAKAGIDQEARFRIDWHLVALPIIQQQSNDPLFIFKQWLARMLILRPIPALIAGESKEETLEPIPYVTNFGAWFSGLLADTPAAYSKIDRFLRLVMPDLKDIQNRPTGTDSRSLSVQFSNEQGSLSVPFENLSDGEKCFMICAIVLAANDAYGPILCFWDEPDNYLAPDEVGHFVVALRKAFQSSGQFIATSHNTQAVSRFSDENTFLLYRNNHLEPTVIRPLGEIQVNGDLVSALTRGDLEP